MGHIRNLNTFCGYSLPLGLCISMHAALLCCHQPAGTNIGCALSHTKQPPHWWHLTLRTAVVLQRGARCTPPKFGSIYTAPPSQHPTGFAAQERLENLGEGIPPLLILPIYSQLPSDLQARAHFPQVTLGLRSACQVQTSCQRRSKGAV